MATTPTDGADWTILNEQFQTLSGQIPAPNPLTATYSFLPTGLVVYFRVGVYAYGNLNIVNCIENSIDYVVVTKSGGRNYFLSLVSTTAPVFKLVELTSSSLLTNFRLRDPRKFDVNTFIVKQQGQTNYVLANMQFRDRTGQYIDFNCPSCPCTGKYQCAGQDCIDPACNNQPCGGTCSGTCNNGGQCLQATDGTWSCVVNCTGKPCGGACQGECAPNLICIEISPGLFTCADPCASGVCGGQCNGPCSVGTCRQANDGTWSCVQECTGQCSGICQGNCPNGQTCLQGPDGNWSCQDVFIETETPIWKKWWFWVSIIVGIIALIVILIFIIRGRRKRDQVDDQSDLKEMSDEEK